MGKQGIKALFDHQNFSVEYDNANVKLKRVTHASLMRRCRID